MKGIIKTLLKDRKCGFIRGEDDREYFFHKSALKNVNYEEIAIGDEVTYEEAETAKGPRAEEVYA